MAKKNRTSADRAALAALLIVVPVVIISLATFTDIDGVWRWGIAVIAGIVAAATAYGIVARLSRSR